MSIAPDLELIEHLDWEHTPQCEHSQHGKRPDAHEGPAYVLVRVAHDCGRNVAYYVCRAWWERVVIPGRTVYCEDCKVYLSAHEVVTALGWVE